MKGFVIVEPLTGIFLLLRLCITFIWLLEMPFFVNCNHYDFNCQHEVFYLKMGYFLFLLIC